MQKALIRMIRDAVGEPKTGVEVGVYKAETSVALIKAFVDCRLYFVDMWKAWDEGSTYHKTHKRTGKLTQDEWDKIKDLAWDKIQHLNRVGDRNIGRGITNHCLIFTLPSIKVAAASKDKEYDFVFIDANHSYQSVKEDLDAWLPKTRGIICGHDFGGTYKGVQKAVEEKFGRDKIISPGKRLWGYIVKDEE